MRWSTPRLGVAAASVVITTAAFACTAVPSTADPSGWQLVQNMTSGSDVISGMVMFSASSGLAIDGIGVDRYDGNHWSGWSHQPPPVKPTRANQLLLSLAARSASDVWVVRGADYGLDTACRSVQRWNGKTWSRVTFSGLPGVLTRCQLLLSPTHVWMTGLDTGTHDGLAGRPFVAAYRAHAEHPSWQVTHVAREGWLAGGTIRAANDAWLVGGTAPGATGYSDRSYFADTEPAVGHPFIYHWNGTSLRRTPVPAVRGTLTAVDAVTADDAMAVGFGPPATPGGATTPLALHWNGTAWQQVEVPGQQPWLRAVAGQPGGTYWASGDEPVGDKSSTFDRYDGSAWTPVPGPDQAAASADDAIVVTNIVRVPGVGGFWASGIAGNQAETGCGEEDCSGRGGDYDLSGPTFYDHHD